jgi:hypothetical protein
MNNVRFKYVSPVASRSGVLQCCLHQVAAGAVYAGVPGQQHRAALADGFQ